MTYALSTKDLAETIEGNVAPSDYYNNPNAWNNWFEQSVGFRAAVPGLGTVELIEIEGESDRLGRRAMLFKVVAPDNQATQYFRKEGYFESFWETWFWDGPLVEIEPKATSVLAWIDK